MRLLTKGFLNLKLSTKLLISFVLIISLSISIVGYSSYSIWKTNKIEDAKDSSRNRVEQMAYNVTYRTSEIEEFISTRLMFSQNLAESLVIKTDDNKYYNDAVRKREFSTFASDMFHMKKEFIEIYVEDIEGEGLYMHRSSQRIISTRSEVIGLSLITERRRSTIIDSWGKSTWLPLAEEKGKVCISRVIFSPSNYKYVGIISISIDDSFLADFYRDSGRVKGRKTIILNPANEIMWGDKEYEYAGLINTLHDDRFRLKTVNSIIPYNKNSYLVSVFFSPLIKWRVIEILPINSLLIDIEKFKRWIFAICLITCLVALINALIISRNISSNIKLLIKKIEYIQNGNFQFKIQPASHDEIGQLAIKFNIMSEKIQELIKTVYLEQLEKNRAEYKALQFEYSALQAQMNPHFLYNTLEIINSLANMGKSSQISDIVKSLGILMRGTIGKKDNIITMEEEINFVKHYLSIQKIMYQDRLVIEYFIDENLLSCLVPRLVIQPILENSIIHGIERKRGTGRISISILQCNEDTVKISVADNGVGMDPQKAEEILMGKVDATEFDNHTHIGLSSVNKRIKILFGSSYGLNIFSRQGEGTIVEVTIPYKDGKETLVKKIT